MFIFLCFEAETAFSRHTVTEAAGPGAENGRAQEVRQLVLT